MRAQDLARALDLRQLCDMVHATPTPGPARALCMAPALGPSGFWPSWPGLPPMLRHALAILQSIQTAHLLRPVCQVKSGLVWAVSLGPSSLLRSVPCVSPSR